MQLLHGGKALFILDEPLNAQVLDQYPRLKVVGCPMTGLDHIDLPELEKRRIKLISLRGEQEFLKTVTSTAEHTIGLILALSRNYQMAFHQPYFPRNTYQGHTLAGKTLGIIGYGRVGKQVARIAKGFGMTVRWVDVHNPKRLRMVLKSDIVSIHIPLAGNEGYFMSGMFNQMKPTAYLINTSRTAVIAPGALLAALKTKTIAGAATDFTDDEGLVKYSEVHPHLILTNHIAGVTFEDREKTDKVILNKINDYLNHV